MATFQDQMGELRTHETPWLRDERARVVTERRRLEVRELAITRVLDERATREREAEDDLIGASRDSARTARQKVEVARALEALPAIAAKAEVGELSGGHRTRHRRPSCRRDRGAAVDTPDRASSPTQGETRPRRGRLRPQGAEAGARPSRRRGEGAGCRAVEPVSPKLEPHGPYRLVGDPDLPDGLRLIDTRTNVGTTTTTTTDADATTDGRAGPAP